MSQERDNAQKCFSEPLEFSVCFFCSLSVSLINLKEAPRGGVFRKSYTWKCKNVEKKKSGVKNNQALQTSFVTLYSTSGYFLAFVRFMYINRKFGFE